MKYELPKKAFEKPKKQFGSGTKGRIDSHAYECREIIKKHAAKSAVSLEFVNEFIAGIDREFKQFDNRNWQKYESSTDALNAFKQWLEPPK